MGKVNALFQDAEEAREEAQMNQFALATEVNGIVMRLALPTMTKLQAEQKAKVLRERSPKTPIYVVNKTAE